MGGELQQQEQFLRYKAEALGKRVAHQDPRYTSQKSSTQGTEEQASVNMPDVSTDSFGQLQAPSQEWVEQLTSILRKMKN